MNTAIFAQVAGLVAAQFGLYALGWGLFSLLLREEREASAHWATFMLLMGLAFVLATRRDEARLWLPYVGSNLAMVLGYVVLRRGLACFMRIPKRDLEVLLTALLVCSALVWSGPGHEHASWRVLLTYGTGVWMLGRALQDCYPPMRDQFGRRTALVVAIPAVLLVSGFSARVLRQLLDWSDPLEMQLDSRLNHGLMLAYLCGAAMFNFSFMAVVTLRLVKRLRDQAGQDPLTGLANRRVLDEALHREWSRWRRGQGGFSVLALDLDHFKHVNDAHGHPAGDRVLEQVANSLRAQMRGADLVARTGGEEFMVLLPGADPDAARRLGQRLIDTVRNQAIGPPGAMLRQTLSCGVATVLSTDVDPQQVMQRADRALYRAKAEGRDRVVSAAEPAALGQP